MKKINKQYIMFDLDGTLTDPKEGITKSVQYSLKHFGITVENLDDLVNFIGPPLWDSYKKYYNFSESDANTAVQKYREYFSERGIFENVIYEGIDSLLANLKTNGKIIILATSKPAVFAEKILRHFDIYKYFEFISGAELDGRRSEKQESINYAIDNCKINSLDTVVMIGDRGLDIIGAKKTGIASIGVLYGYGSYEELNNAGADYIVSSVSELNNILIDFLHDCEK